MPIIDPNNPLSAIGASNDPSLTARTTAQNQGAINLQNALGQLASKGQNDRKLRAQADEAAAYRTGLGLNLNTRGDLDKLRDDLAQKFGDVANASRAGAFQADATGMNQMNDLGFAPVMQDTAGATASRNNSLRSVVPTSILKGKVHGSDAAVRTAEAGQNNELSGMSVNIGGENIKVGSAKYKDSTSTKNTAKVTGSSLDDIAKQFNVPHPAQATQPTASSNEKAIPEAVVQTIVRAVKTANSKSKITAVFYNDQGQLMATVDGVDRPVNINKNK